MASISYLLEMCIYMLLMLGIVNTDSSQTENRTQVHTESPPMLVMTTSLGQPWVVKRGATYTGFLSDLLDNVAEMVGFRYSIHVSSNQGYNTQSRLDEIMKKVYAGEADFGISDYTAVDGQTLLTFSEPFMITGANIMLQKPLDSRTSTLALLLRPFTWGVWVLLAITVLLVSGSFWVISNLFVCCASENAADDKRDSLMKSFVFSVTCYWQGFKDLPRSRGGKILAVFWWFFSTLTLLAYVANLTCLLMSTGTTKPVLPFKSFSEMAAQADVTYGGWFGMILNPHDELHHRLNLYISSKYTHYPNMEEAVTRIRRNDVKFAAIVDGLQGEYVTNNNCDIVMLSDKLFDIFYGFFCSNDTNGQQLCDNISSAVVKLRSDGAISKLYLKWWHNKCPVTSENDYISATRVTLTSFRALSVENLTLTYTLLIVGLVISLIVTAVERCLGTSRNRRKPSARKEAEDGRVINHSATPTRENLVNQAEARLIKHRNSFVREIGEEV